MPIEFTPASYSDLNPAQKENYNYHKVSARLADYGYTTIRLHDDFQGADFIAKHIDGERYLKVQLKGRLTFDEKYSRTQEQDTIYIAFRDEEDWYLYPHDEVLDRVINEIGIIAGTDSWESNGTYHIGSLSSDLYDLMAPYRVPTLEEHERSVQ